MSHESNQFISGIPVDFFHPPEDNRLARGKCIVLIIEEQLNLHGNASAVDWPYAKRRRNAAVSAPECQTFHPQCN